MDLPASTRASGAAPAACRARAPRRHLFRLAQTACNHCRNPPAHRYGRAAWNGSPSRTPSFSRRFFVLRLPKRKNVRSGDGRGGRCIPCAPCYCISCRMRLLLIQTLSKARNKPVQESARVCASFSTLNSVSLRLCALPDPEKESSYRGTESDRESEPNGHLAPLSDSVPLYLSRCCFPGFRMRHAVARGRNTGQKGGTWMKFSSASPFFSSAAPA
jgi:hypothetical protein